MTYGELLKRLLQEGEGLEGIPVLIHYDGDYEAEIINVRLAQEGDMDRSSLHRAPHIIIEVRT